MLKRFMATTALVAIATSAYAATPITTGNDKSAMSPQAMNYVSNIDSSDLLATNLIGQAVYSGGPNGEMMPNASAPAPDTQAQNTMKNGAGNNGTANNGAANNTGVAQNNQEHIGNINNLIVAQDGSIDAVVIGVGGFLGIGEKDVAVPFDSLQWSTDANGKPVAYLATTKDQLQSAPEFDVSMLQKNANGQNANGPANQMALNPANPTPDAATNVPDRNSLQQADATKISAKDLTGTTVFDADNQNVGDVGDVIVTKDGKIDAVVVDVGGFLGIGEKPVAIAFEDLDVRTDQNGDLTVYTSFTKDQLDNAPKYDKSAYENQRDQMRLHTQG